MGVQLPPLPPEFQERWQSGNCAGLLNRGRGESLAGVRSALFPPKLGGWSPWGETVLKTAPTINVEGSIPSPSANNALLAQLVEASALGAEGSRFESVVAHQALVAQLAEAPASNPGKCWFKSSQGHQLRAWRNGRRIGLKTRPTGSSNLPARTKRKKSPAPARARAGQLFDIF